MDSGECDDLNQERRQSTNRQQVRDFGSFAFATNPCRLSMQPDITQHNTIHRSNCSSTRPSAVQCSAVQSTKGKDMTHPNCVFNFRHLLVRFVSQISKQFPQEFLIITALFHCFVPINHFCHDSCFCLSVSLSLCCTYTRFSVCLLSAAMLSLCGGSCGLDVRSRVL